MDLAAFRAHFPEFADDTAYPNALVAFWSGLVEKRLPPLRWGELYAQGVELACAHYVAVATANAVSPGQAQGLQTSKAVGDVSASYDVAAIAEQGGGHWNQTSYGRQFLELARTVGIGGAQL